MAMAHDALEPIRGLQIVVLCEELGDLSLDGLRKQGARPLRKISVSWSVKVPG